MTGRRTAVISGANRGLGFGIAQAFAEAGVDVYALNRSFCGESWMTEISCDLGNPDDIRAACGKLLALCGGSLDYVILNAAIRRLAPVGQLPVEEWLASVDTNLSAPYLIIAECMEALRPGCDVFMIGSRAAEDPFSGGAAYSATKAGIRQLAETLSLELRPKGVRCTHVLLGAIANRPKPMNEYKMSPREIGDALVSITEMPGSLLCSEVVLRPMNAAPQTEGIERILGW